MDENLQAGNAKTKTNGQRNQETPNIAKTVRILRVEIQSCRAYNERLNKGPGEQNQLNATILQSSKPNSNNTKANASTKFKQ